MIKHYEIRVFLDFQFQNIISRQDGFGGLQQLKMEKRGGKW